MKKNIWGYEKAYAFLSVGLVTNMLGPNKNKVRRRGIIQSVLRAKRPVGGYKTYTVRRSKPNFTIKSENLPDDLKQFWEE